MNIIEDERPIKSIHTANEGIFAGLNGVDEIVPYPENGQMAVVVWFAVYFDGNLVRRVNGAFVESVVYDQQGVEPTPLGAIQSTHEISKGMLK